MFFWLVGVDVDFDVVVVVIVAGIVVVVVFVVVLRWSVNSVQIYDSGGKRIRKPNESQGFDIWNVDQSKEALFSIMVGCHGNWLKYQYFEQKL